jgi:hypothetical protein
MDTKRCSTCGEVKQTSEFGKNKTHSGGLNSECKICARARGRVRSAKYRSENTEKIRAYQAKYRTENTEKERARHAKYRTENTEKERAQQSKYRSENTEKIRAYQAKYRTENPEKNRAQQAKYRSANKDDFREFEHLQRLSLCDKYVKKRLRENDGFAGCKISQGFVELKRGLLEVKRILKVRKS